MAQQNGHANGFHVPKAIQTVFPEAHQSLAQADPEIYALVEQEKVRQW